METLELPFVGKANIEKEVKTVAASYCAEPVDESVCCTPGESSEENGCDCYPQPEDGSACCNK